MDKKDFIQAIDNNFEETIKTTKDFLRIQNFVINKENINEAINFLRNELEVLGARVEIKDYGDLPVMYAELDEGAKNTIAVYKNFDIVIPEEAGWKYNPFEAAIGKENNEGEVIYGVGAAEPKGPLISFITGLKAYKAFFGKLPLNIIFLLEADEQIGSPSLPKLVEEKRKNLINIKTGIFPEFSETSKSEALIPLSVKGIIYLELICRGGEWGGPSKISLHSSNAAWIKSPVWRLIQALNTMIDINENILIDGFYKGIKEIKCPPELISKSRIQDMINFMRNRYTLQFKYDLEDEELFFKYVNTPTLNITNLMTIQSRRWMKFVLPYEIRARLDIRLVKGMDADEVIKSIREHLDGFGYKDIEMLVHMKYPSWEIDYNDEMIKILQETYKEIGRDSAFLPCSGTSLPLYVFDKLLKKPLLIAGLGRAARAYHANEYLPLKSIKEFQLSYFYLLNKIAGC